MVESCGNPGFTIGHRDLVTGLNLFFFNNGPPISMDKFPESIEICLQL
jgi:hypothetical protein